MKMTLQRQLLTGQIISLLVLAALLAELVNSPIYSKDTMTEKHKPATANKPEISEVRFPVIMWAGQINQGKSYEIPQGAILPVLRNQELPNGDKLN